MLKIDLNADLGEGGEQDEALMTLASSVNIACGGHAGDNESIRRAVGLAIQAHVAIGAHPGYEDPAHFGRRTMKVSGDEIRGLIHRQLERILAIHPRLHHVKPHGALYNQSNQDEAMAEALVAAIAGIQPDTILYCPPHGALARAAAGIRLATCAEGFIDRRYQEDGNLCPRTEVRALIEDAEEAVSQALKIAIQQTVTTLKGTTIPLEVRTLCVHGEGPNAVDLLRLTRSSLKEAGTRIMAP
jgi:UPF0271 protein